MARRIEVRNVPADLHEEMVGRAKARGQTLTEFVGDILEGRKPAADDLVARFLQIEPVDLDRPLAKTLRVLRKTIEIQVDR